MGEAQRRPVRHSLERRNLIVAVAVVRRAATFGAHHAGADGVFGRTCVAEQRAVAWRDGTAQHVAAAASAWLNRRFNGHVKAGAGIKAREFGSDGKTRIGNRSQPAPRGVARLKYLLDQLACYGIAVCIDAAAVGVVDRRPAFDNHLDQHADALQDIDRLKPGDHARGLELIDQKPKGCQACDGSDVTRQDKAVDGRLGVVEIARRAGGVVL